MQKFGIFAAALMAGYPSVSLAQVDSDWSRREVERMQAQQERWDAQNERQRAKLDRGVTRGSEGGANWLDVFGISPNRRREKAVGKMLAAGDCAGAEKYALENGEFDLLDRVKAHCAQATSIPAPKTAHEASWLFVAGEKGGLEFYADPKSFRNQGTNMSYWSRMVLPADNPWAEIITLNFYRCRDRTNAIKEMVIYSRDGTVENTSTEDRDLKFDPLEPKTEAEKSLYNSACRPRSSSK